MKKDDHEIYKVKSKGNIIIGLLLFAFVMLVFSVSVVKIMSGTMAQAPDHVLRPEIIPQGEKQ